MEKPESVKRGVALIWVSLGVWALGALVVRWLGGTSDAFMMALFSSALCCIIPYKLANGSNAARYFYAVLFAVSLLAVAGGVAPLESVGFAARSVDIATNVLTTIIEAVSLYYLFGEEASTWFRHQRAKAIKA